MTQNLILILAFAAVVWRICLRRMTAVEWGLLAFVAGNIFLVQLQMFVGEDGKITWILRYHQAAVVLLYGWAAWGVVALVDRLSGRWRLAAVTAVALWLIATGGTSLWRIAKQAFVDSSRSARARSAQWAVKLIKADWKGPLRDSGRFFTVQGYHSSRRPIILSDGAYLPNLLRGRWYSLAPDIRRYERPDYALLPDGRQSPGGMDPMAEVEIGKKKRKFIL
jgi:hypothetical protein